jgi:multidrug efflux pump
MAFVQQSNGSNFGSIFATLDPFSERRSPGLKDTAIIAKLKKRWAEEIRDATVTAASASPIPGLSVAGGFKLMVKDQAGIGLAALQKQTDALVNALSETPGLTGVSTNFRSKTPQLFMDINRDKIESLGVNFGDAFQTLQIYLGSSYVNDFNKYGRHWHVTLQAAGQYRTQADSLNLFQVRNRSGQMVSLSSLVDIRDTVGPLSLNRFNLATAAPITGSIVNGFSSSDVIDATEKEAAIILPRTMRAEWTDLMFLQIKEGNTTITVFSLAVFCVFLTLAALYESWSLPLAVILVVPLCVLCSLIGVLWTGTSVNIFVQIGLVVLVGLACKNAILIVEFAKELSVHGKPLAEATREASRLRLRPILMTSLAFIFGVLPLVFANGAGAEMRRSLGTAVFSGMVGVTFFGIFLTPVFFYVLRGAGELRMFAGPMAFRIWSYVGGISLGATAGFLLSRLGVVDPLWAPIVGGAAGASTVAAALGIAGRPIKPWKSA